MKNKLLTIGLICSLISGNILSQELTAEEIIKKVDDKLLGKTAQVEMTITIVRPKWTREMSMKSWSKGTDLSVVLITAPAKEQGTVFLLRDKEAWNWVPSIERTIKLPPSMMLQSWMGSDFTNDDLVKQSSIVKDYTHKVVGDSIIEGRNCYKIELIPKSESAVVWGRILTWIDKKDFLQLRTEFYDEDDYIVNVMIGKEIKMLGDKLLPSIMEMIPVNKEGQKTVIEYKSIVFDESIEDIFFTTQYMKKIK